MCGRLLRVTLGLALAGACAREPSPKASSGASSAGLARPDEVVAMVDTVPIHQSEVKAQMLRSGKPPRAALEDLVTVELLAAAAARSPAAREREDDPEARERARSAAVQRLIERELEWKLSKDRIPDAEVRALYERARDAFVHPRLVEIAILSVYTGPRMKPEPRARARETARALDVLVRSRPQRTAEDLEAIANDPQWRERKVKFNRTLQGTDHPFPAAVGQAAARLIKPGDTTSLIEDDSGYHIARYLSERPPRNVSFEEARAELRDTMFERWRQARFLEFVQDLAGPHEIEAYPDRLDRLRGL